jgi:hypothetical protein
VRYRLNAPRFAAERFDHEAIVLDLEGGVYYSLEGLAAWLFHELAGGADRAALLALAPAVHRDAALAVAEQLAREGLIVEDAGSASAPSPPPADATAPQLTRYDDLQLLLQIDPVHDVDASGWPHPPAV